MRFPIVYQKDCMQCGIACLAAISQYYGIKYSLNFLEQFCFVTTEGVSLKGLEDAAHTLGFKTHAGKLSLQNLKHLPLPCILHWNRNHFVVLYKINKKGNRFYISDPGKGRRTYTLEEFIHSWGCAEENGDIKGIAMFLELTNKFGLVKNENNSERKSFSCLLNYFLQYKKYFIQIIVGLLVGCILQLILPFLTQWIVDIGITYRDVGFIWLVLLGELMIVFGRTATDFVRRWLLLHISMRINISLVSDFFIKLLKLPMAFFETKLMGDLLQRIGDHARVQNFLTGQVLNIVFTCLSFIIYGVVLCIYNPLIFGVFVDGSVVYGIWIASFLSR